VRLKKIKKGVVVGDYGINKGGKLRKCKRGFTDRKLKERGIHRKQRRLKNQE